ncbi:unnamed protein product [Nippostrongylus brasiliensis]|uniref:Cyclin N-terminal domain-containing protein n=1 Tax=Nippostrongylus brasiliensis TaxID=27835 RepID=A0A0N4XCN4_NIPBR|nr:unnamed protein product [Nippostrongylus brasiliensis]
MSYLRKCRQFAVEFLQSLILLNFSFLIPSTFLLCLDVPLVSFAFFDVQKVSFPLFPERITSASEIESDYLTLESVQYIFTVCVRLRLPHDIRYLAVLIFAKFMRIHTAQVFDFLNGVQMSENRRLREWEKVEANLSRQTTLRMLSSIQIASKALSYHDVRAALKLEFPLTDFKKSVIEASVFVFTVVGYGLYPASGSQVGTTTFTSIRFILVASWPQVDIHSIWEHTLLFMDIVFLHHEQVYLSDIMSRFVSF